ncbi:MAG: ABC transporter substrate-binding protein [Deltaproteobacteria bacterium]|nr:ABC transporter substrate-binding protein [Deltaproteobacteria bacterium]
MKHFKTPIIFIALVCCACLLALPQAHAGRAAFDVNKMADMSDFDPNNVVKPKGDTIKIGLVQMFSGAGAGNGQIYWLTCNWVAHDINKRGGILVDGKRKMVEFIKGDNKGKPADCKKAVERLILKDKVDILWGVSGSHLSDIISQAAKKYKIIYQNAIACSDFLMDAKHFNRYTFMTYSRTSSLGAAGAYYYGQRNKEKKFYILGQDYAFGHALADGFKEGLKKYFPAAQIVGEDYHPLFAKDFAPYVTKIQASGAEVIFTGDRRQPAQNLPGFGRGYPHPERLCRRTECASCRWRGRYKRVGKCNSLLVRSQNA